MLEVSLQRHFEEPGGDPSAALGVAGERPEFSGRVGCRDFRLWGSGASKSGLISFPTFGPVRAGAWTLRENV